MTHTPGGTGIAAIQMDGSSSSHTNTAALDLIVLDILTEIAGTGYTHHVPLLANKSSNYQNVHTAPKTYKGVALADPDGVFTATLTAARSCIQAWLAANNTVSLSTAMCMSSTTFQHEHCSLRVATPPATLATAPAPPAEAIDLCTLQHMIEQLHPQLEVDTQEDGYETRPLFNTMHHVDAPYDQCAAVQPLDAPLVLPNRCRFLMSDIRRLHLLIAGAAQC